MCVSTAPAELSGTRAFTYAVIDSSDPRALHVSGYQNSAKNLHVGPNCMLLHFPGRDIKLVDGPQQTRSLMDDMTRQLPEIMYVPRTRGGAFLGSTRSMARVEQYGSYDVVLAEDAGAILAALEQVQPHRRPQVTASLEALVAWYQDNYHGHSFVLACFDGSVECTHPIVVEYIPYNDDVLFVPGLDCHTGDIPAVGQPMQRDIAVAYGAMGVPQPYRVHYSDDCSDQWWAPLDVTGFIDNRPDGLNGDYTVALESINHGHKGRDLLDLCF